MNIKKISLGDHANCGYYSLYKICESIKELFANAKSQGISDFYLESFSSDSAWAGSISNLDYLIHFKDLDIRTFALYQGSRTCITDSEGLKYLTKVRKIELSGMDFKVLKGVNPIYDEETGNLISGCPLLTWFSLTGSRAVMDVSILSECSQLDYIYIVTCSISDIYGFDKLNNLSKLYLHDNALNNNAIHIIDEDNSINYNPIEIFITLNGKKLRYLNISTNSFDSYSTISTLTWTKLTI